MMKRRIFLQTKKDNIYLNQKKILLRGVNLGGWLMMEGYILHSLNDPVRLFKRRFSKLLGDRALSKFESSYLKNFIVEKDIEKISQMGFNCLRIPFHHRLIEKKPYQYDLKGISYLDQVIDWAKRYNLWIILDLHAACGCQNYDWHSDSLGNADLWNKRKFQKRTIALWEYLSERYKNCSTIAGYDLLNEAVVADKTKLNKFYKDLIKHIRAIDKNHLIFVEGNHWATDINCLDRFKDDNLVLSVHFYEPLDFTFNFVPLITYPIKSNQKKKDPFNKSVLKKILQNYKKISLARKVPIFVGEFGINYRKSFFGEDQWLRDVLACFQEFDFHWTYWTYKAVKNALFPDGLYSYRENPPWIRRHGPRMGWENYSEYWLTQKKEMIESWQTDQFQENMGIIKVFKNELKNFSKKKIIRR